jgi:hypothetical protein
LRAWLTGVNPIAEPQLTADGVLTFENAAVAARVAGAPTAYGLTWARFDNATGTHAGESVEMRVTEPRASAPKQVLEGSDFVAVAVQTVHSDYPAWRLPVMLTFRRTATGWQTVGIERTVSD